MSAPSNSALAALLGLAPPPEGLLSWHARICEGFPQTSLKTLASFTGVPTKELAHIIGASPSSKKDLSSEASNGLYRVAVVWAELQGLFPDAPKEASRWLVTAYPGLRGRVPLALLSSAIGYDYVRAAIERAISAR